MDRSSTPTRSLAKPQRYRFATNGSPIALRTVLFGLSLLFVAAGCGDSGDTEAGIAIAGGGSAANVSSTLEAEDGVGGDDDDDADSGTDDDRSEAEGEADTGDGDQTTGPGDEDLPGEPFDFVPAAGTRFDVIGVRYDDVLNFRTEPSASSPIVDTAAPLEDTPVITSTGVGRLLPNSIWWKVTVGGTEAWVNQRFLGMLGVSYDALPAIADQLDSTTGSTIESLLDNIAATYETEGDDGYEMVSDIEAIDATGAQVTIDVLGFPDDSVQGERLLLTFDFQFDGDEVTAYQLVAADGTSICSRGITEDKLCT